MADEIKMIFSGAEEFQKAIEKWVTQANLGAIEFVTKGAHVIEKNAKQRAPVKSGRLRRSIRLVDVTSLGFGVAMSRTAPGTIYARRRELGFQGWTQGNRPQFVQHDPGKPYLAPAVKDSKDELTALSKSVWGKRGF